MELITALRSSDGADETVENQAYAFGHVSRHDAKAIIRLRSIVTIHPHEYAVRKKYGVRLKPEGLARIVDLAGSHDGVVIKFHRHPLADGLPIDGFSLSDDDADRELKDVLGRRGRFFSVLLADLPADDYLFVARTPDLTTGFDYLSVVELKVPLRVHTSYDSPRLDADLFSRAAQEFGRGIVNGLSKLHVGVIGCGGLGWRAAQDLADSGIGGLTLIDFDRVEPKNLPRLPGATRTDCGELKVDVLARVLRERYDDLGLETHALNVIEALDRVDEQREGFVDILKSCDVLLLTTDNHPSRFAVMLVAEREMIPYVCSGMHPIAGNNMFQDLSVHVPGITACAACRGLIDRKEASKRGAGYIRGARMPNVAAWNAIAAGNIANAVRMLAVPLDNEDLARRNAWQIGLSEASVTPLPTPAGRCDICGP